VPKAVPNNFKIGKYKTILEDNDITSFAERNDSIQIETYNNKKDTFSIQWISNFEYVLLKKNPKSKLDSTPFYVKITGIKKNSYNFKAYYKGSNFKQKGKAIKLD
jgi:hypothetical protein